MDTTTIIAIVGGAILLVALAYWFLRRDTTALPPERPEPTAREAKPAERTPAPRADAARPAEAERAQGKGKGKKKKKKRSAAARGDVPSDPAPARAPLAAELAPPAPAAGPARSAEDVAALKKGLAATRGGFVARLAQLFGRKPEIDPALLDEIQEVLLTADIGVRTAERILERLKARLDARELGSEEAVWSALRAEALAILRVGGGAPRLSGSPSVVLVVGVNGVGKTTTIGKLASLHKDAGKTVILAAGDTFRAAAVLQLEVWGRRVGCEVVKGKDRADPASVIFEAIKRAQETGADLVIADTAGRLHTKANLMEELKKVVRTAEKALGRPLDEVLLVLDSTTGQNAIQQAQLFKEAIAVSGLALTKLDGTAKGGVILGIVAEHQVPVHFIGIGERVEDLREFEAESFVDALFSRPDDAEAE